ncbi:MAG TPA: immunoglobulin domain-containing protein, partial [Candidatus Dormibacteraeota bacterium]|nr:immunoglobulin domain-containing protein [Candidatus Dormibacteraeota bacterium]
ETVSNYCGGTRVVSRVWTATDVAGNTTNAVQTITVRDILSLAIPPDLTLECPANNAGTNYTGVAVAQDRCSAVVVTFSDVTTTNCGGSRVIARTWTATNACGNTTNAVQTITLRDSNPPSLTIPQNLTVDCAANTGTNSTGSAVAQDGCSSVTLAYSDTVTTNAGSYAIRRLWTATDACGNSTNATQTITVRDTTPPTIAALLVNTLSQSNQTVQLLQTNFATTFTNGIIIGEFNPSNGVSAPNGLLWQPTLAGSTALQTVLSIIPATAGTPFTQDATNPATAMGGGNVARQALLLTLNIGFNSAGVLGVGPNNFGSLIYSNGSADSLDGRPISKILDAANGALAGSGLPAGYDFNALASLLSNLNLAFQNYTPSAWASAHLSAPMLVVQCSGQVPAPNPAYVTASDSCGGTIAVTNLPDTYLSYVNAGNYTLLRTWVAKDAAGNTNSCSYQIVVNDTTSPTLTVAPTTQNVLVGGIWSFAGPTASDNCGAVTVTVLNTTTNLTATNTMLVARTWLATDIAGNTNTCCQTVVLATAVAPTIITQPSGETLGYGGDGKLSVSAGGTGPFTYQWRLNGTNIAGATGSSLNWSGLDFTNAGLYSVVVTGPGGSVTSGIAVVNVLPVLTSQTGGKRMILSWPGQFVLQSADAVAGPYTDVPAATSPYLTRMTGPQKFFRLRSVPATLSLKVTGAQPTVNLTGSSGENFIVQASTDLVHWSNLRTNTLPMSVTDTDASRFPSRFYRAIMAH